MEETLVLKVQKRDAGGSKAAARIRQQGRIPAIVYGHKKEPVSVSLDQHDFVEGLHHGHRLMEVRLGRKKETVLVKDLQYDFLGRDIIHVDFIRVDVTEMVTVTVPIELKGAEKAKGVEEEGGIIEGHVDGLEVECRVTNIPESFVVSVREMNVGDTLHASDVELPEGVELACDPETLIVTCSIVTTKTTEEVEEETPAAPEVIGEAEEEQPREEGEESKEQKTE